MRAPGYAWAFVRIVSVALVLGLGPGVLCAQDTSAETTVEWQPPEVNRLPLDWWAQIDGDAPEGVEARMRRFLEAAQIAVDGLHALELVSGQNLLQNVRGQYELLMLARQSYRSEQFGPIPKRKAYVLQELLDLRAQWRDMDHRRRIAQLRQSELQSQANLLRQRIDDVLRQYLAADENAPTRTLLGLQRVSARLEYELTLEQSAESKRRLDEMVTHLDQLEDQLEFARKNLFTGIDDLDELDGRIEAAQREVNRLDEKQASDQRQLLQVLTDSESRPSLEILRKQQLTRDSAYLSLARLQALRLRAERAWHQLRRNALPPGFDIQASVEEAASYVRESQEQAVAWTTASQTTILTPAPEAKPNSEANMALAHAAARETLDLIENMDSVIDELALLGEVLTEDQVSMQTGLGSALTRLRIVLYSARKSLAEHLDITLFHIADAPVTIGSIFKMLIILVFGLALSWFIRHLLKRLEDRRQFAKSPAVYTLGRLLHYLIILIAVFAAFGSIGLDFSNFALIAGALSVGIGFGLQSIVNNFVSGLILLFEGSLRVGDYIELENGLRGIVKEINTRATVVNTNDSIDVVVPNSMFVTNQLTNWTLREPLARFRIEFGVAYGSDKETVRQAAMEAAAESEYIVHHTPGRAPELWLVNFGESALVFQLLAWVSKAGVRRPERVKAAFLWHLETRLREHGIEIPFPQRDLHLRSGFSPIAQTTPVKLEPEHPNADG